MNPTDSNEQRSLPIKRAAFWTALDSAAALALNFLVIIFLARLLSPADFGTFAVLALFLGLANTIVEGGLGQALIQRQEISNVDKSTVFWTSVGLAIIISSTLLLLAPHLSIYYELPQLSSLTKIAAASVLFSSLATVPRALFIKDLDFRRLMIARVSSAAVAGIIALLAAGAGYGVFAFAIQVLTASVISSTMLLAMSSWAPQALFSVSSVRQLFGYGGYLLAASVLDVVYTRIYTLLIGKQHGPTALGYFERADATATMATAVIVSPISQLAFPAFSQLNAKAGDLAWAMRAAIKFCVLLSATSMLVLLSLAEPIVKTLYGDQWDETIPLLQILSIGGVLMPIHVLNLQALMALGRSDLFFRLDVIKKILGVTILLASSFWGPIGISWGIVIAGFLALFVNTWYSNLLLGYGLLHQLIDALPGVLVAVTVAVSIRITLEFIVDEPYLVKLILGMMSGLTVFAASMFVWRLLFYHSLPAVFRRQDS